MPIACRHNVEPSESWRNIAAMSRDMWRSFEKDPHTKPITIPEPWLKLMISTRIAFWSATQSISRILYVTQVWVQGAANCAGCAGNRISHRGNEQQEQICKNFSSQFRSLSVINLSALCQGRWWLLYDDDLSKVSFYNNTLGSILQPLTALNIFSLVLHTCSSSMKGLTVLDEPLVHTWLILELSWILDLGEQNSHDQLNERPLESQKHWPYQPDGLWVLRLTTRSRPEVQVGAGWDSLQVP